MSIRHMSGAGNTFIVLDDRISATAGDDLTPEAARELLARHPRSDGRPIEGLVRIRHIDSSALQADFFNPDGSRGMLCGNGARCAVRYALDHGASPARELDVEFNGTHYIARSLPDESISITLPPPSQLRYFPVGSLENVSLPVWYANVNSDHVVIDVPHDAANPVVSVLRHHPDFPRGANVNLLIAQDDGTLRLATFERGVEAITQACGTGAVSAALSMWMRNPLLHAFNIIPPSQRRLFVQINEEGGHITSIELRGDATYDNT